MIIWQNEESGLVWPTVLFQPQLRTWSPLDLSYSVCPLTLHLFLEYTSHCVASNETLEYWNSTTREHQNLIPFYVFVLQTHIKLCDCTFILYKRPKRTEHVKTNYRVFKVNRFERNENWKLIKRYSYLPCVLLLFKSVQMFNGHTLFFK